MSLYEIVRDDDAVVFQEARTRSELEKEFLSNLRLNNQDSKYTVHKLDDNMNRIGRKKTYVSFNNDADFQEALHGVMGEVYSRFVKKIEDSGLKSGVGVIDEHGNITISGDVDVGENCDVCEDYEVCDLPVKKPKGE